MKTTTHTTLFLAALSLTSFGCVGPGFDDDPDLEAGMSGITRADRTEQSPWVVAIRSGTKSCTGSVLSSHWILTAAHCVNVAQSSEVDVMMNGNYHVYQGAATYYPHPSWDTTIVGGVVIDADSDDDIGLIHLDEADGVPLSRTGQAKLFADAREPYHGTWANRYFHIIGWGPGTDRGGSSDCDDASPRRDKRIGVGFQVNVSGDTHQTHAPYGSTHPCKGDSGSPWLFSRGPAGAKEDMVFGVMSSLRLDTIVTSPKMWAALVPPRKEWFESRSAGTAHPLTCRARFLGDWRYLRCDEPALPLEADPPIAVIE
jgi:hypothetical protein